MKCLFSYAQGDIILFNPGDNHACVQSDDGTLDYRGFHISKNSMSDLMEEITGNRTLPIFMKNVLQDDALTCYLRSLHEMVMHGTSDFGKEENLLLLLSTLIQHCGQSFENCTPKCRQEVEKACAFIQQHFQERLSLDQICHDVGLSKSTLLRAFTKEKGITPYRYLETIRINAAKELLKKGLQPIDAAMQTGFSDQSHFTNYFHHFIGLAPGVYREIFFHRNQEEE